MSLSAKNPTPLWRLKYYFFLSAQNPYRFLTTANCSTVQSSLLPSPSHLGGPVPLLGHLDLPQQPLVRSPGPQQWKGQVFRPYQHRYPCWDAPKPNHVFLCSEVRQQECTVVDSWILYYLFNKISSLSMLSFIATQLTGHYKFIPPNHWSMASCNSSLFLPNVWHQYLICAVRLTCW